jgi:hypothetical protein
VTSAGEPQWVASSNHPGPARPARPGMLVASQEPDSPPSPSREAARRRPGCPQCPRPGIIIETDGTVTFKFARSHGNAPSEQRPSIATDPDPGTGGESARIDIPRAAPGRRRSPGRLDGNPLVRWPAVPNVPSTASLKQRT